MKTFKGNTTFEFKIVVPDQLLKDLRADAKLDLSSEFLRIADQRHPENDDAFLEAIIKHGVRASVKANLLELMANSGMGGTVSPPSVNIIGKVPDGFDTHVQVQVLTKEDKAAQPPVLSGIQAEVLDGQLG